MDFRILELFSGIGGMHYALNYAELPGNVSVAAAMDINTVANMVYEHNHSSPVLNNNIQKLNARTVEKLGVNMLLMSPPCQPHTRVGNHRDVADHRSDALSHLCTLLPQCMGLQYVLMENVKGFESSQARQDFVEALQKAGYNWREFILSPTQLGVPNTRHRYYCLARKCADFPFSGESIWQRMPPTWLNPDHRHDQQDMSIAALLEPAECIPAEAYLPEKVLSRRVWLLDIVSADACNTMCFTKAYTHYSEGTGSVFTPLSAAEVHRMFAQLKVLEQEDEAKDRLTLLNDLRLRYFTPREVARLMSFPDCFDFPEKTTTRQRYRLLGNSINVRVVGELIKLLCS